MQTPAPPDHAHWLDVLPLLPLDRGVPVVQRIGQGIATGIAIQADVIRWDGDLGRRHGSVGRAHVDLNDPQGYAYALQILTNAERGPSTLMGILQVPSAERMWTETRLHRGRVTDADRLALAHALCEVTP